MTYIADLGGMRGLGPVQASPAEPVFHENWERQICSTNMAVWFAGAWCADENRHSMEKMSPEHYLHTSYYEHWLHFMENLLVDKGIVTWEEVHTGKSSSISPACAALVKIAPAACWPAFLEGGSTWLPATSDPAFAVGDIVRCKVINPSGHTRLPKYARGRQGVVVAYRGSFDLSDTRAQGLTGNSQHQYGVRFTARELWGEDGVQSDAVYLDLFESYLEPKL